MNRNQMLEKKLRRIIREEMSKTEMSHIYNELSKIYEISKEWIDLYDETAENFNANDLTISMGRIIAHAQEVSRISKFL